MKYAVIWIDHKEARIVKLDDESPRYQTDHVEAQTGHLGEGHARILAEPKYLEDLARRLSELDEVLVTGPGTAKNELVSFIERKHPAWRAKIAKVEDSDQPTDGELADQGRKLLGAAGRMRGLHVR